MQDLLPGFEPLPMRWPGDCGPTAMLQLLRFAEHSMTYEEILRAWQIGWPKPLIEDHERVVEPEMRDRLDTPGHHLRTLRRLGVRFAFRRRLARRTITRALDGGFPVALLLPTGAVRWHWIVACGHRAGAESSGQRRRPDRAIVSAGDGTTHLADWEALDQARLRHAASRLVGIDGLGYVAGWADPPFATDRALERDVLRLAEVAEEALAPVEPVFAWLEACVAKIGWKRAAWRDILRVE